MAGEILTKDQLIDKLNSYALNPDDYCVLYKERIKEALLGCPDLLFALNAKELEGELFNEDGTINNDGDWSAYFGKYILPYLYLPDVQADTDTFLCFNVGFSDFSNGNDLMVLMEITFTILVDLKYAIDDNTGIARQDLIGSIIRERFNWSNIFGQNCFLVSNKESITDNNYIVRTLIFQATVPNSILQTEGGKTKVINKKVRR